MEQQGITGSIDQLCCLIFPRYTTHGVVCPFGSRTVVYLETTKLSSLFFSFFLKRPFFRALSMLQPNRCFAMFCPTSRHNQTKVILPPEEAHRGLPIEPWNGLDMASTGK